MKITREMSTGDRIVSNGNRIATPRGGGYWHVEELDSHGEADLLEAWVSRDRARVLLLNNDC